MPVPPIEAAQRPVSSSSLRPSRAAEAGDRFEDVLDRQDAPPASEPPQETQAEPEHEDEEDDNEQATTADPAFVPPDDLKIRTCRSDGEDVSVSPGALSGETGESAEILECNAISGAADILVLSLGAKSHSSAKISEDKATVPDNGTPKTDAASGFTLLGSTSAASEAPPREAVDRLSPDSVTPPDLARHEPLEAAVGGLKAAVEVVLHQGREVRAEMRGTAAVHPPHPTAPHEVTRQIADAVRNSDETRFEITLTPEELGKVRLVISPGERPSVAVYAENRETLDLLRRNADLLDRELRDAGLGGAALSFGQGTAQDGNPRHSGTSFSGHDAGSVRTEDSPQGPRPSQGITLRQLDIRI
ncbi:flagellar hook-length control protein FliK [Paracoccus yeei]|uniref:Flagellar hook-length control protein FliK n=2 Tax=Paracoccus yeei TaxID=147645 RepID=A0A386UMK2_9RHOB|nr:flagellar hook-length control protein FliK [Paracoccus yeei]AYF01548.1 flagellar hook-length control protein FliK [Paracoccus yeei]